MATVTLRGVKGSPLTYAELDGNFSNLNVSKLEVVNLSTISTANTTTIVNTGGSNVTLNSASASNSGLLSASDKTKLDLLNGKTVVVSTTAPDSPNIGDLWLDIS